MQRNCSFAHCFFVHAAHDERRRRPVPVTLMRPVLVLISLVTAATAFMLPRPSFSSRQGVSLVTSNTRKVNARGVRAPTMMAAVRKINGEELEKELTEWNTPIVLDVFATWCGPCQLLAVELEKIAGLYGSKLRILKVDSDEEPRVATALKVYGLPTVLFIKGGQLVHRMEGALPASELTKLINTHLFGAPSSTDA